MNDEILKIQNVDLADIWKGKKSGVEENVKIIIVLPLLLALGFDPQKDMDFEHFVENKRADIALTLGGGHPKVVVECKSLEKNLDDYISQALNYAIKEEIPYILLTNGKEFRLYKPFIENLVNPKDRLLVSANLKTLVNDYRELKDWISKESLTQNKIDKKAKKVVEKLRAEITPKTLIENLKNAKKVLTEDAKTKILPKLNSDLEFRKLVDEWIKDSELDVTKPEEWTDILANEIAYSFINKLYFYRIAEDRGIVKPKLNKQAVGQITQYFEYNDLMKMAFAEILRIDYEAIFRHDIFDKIDFNEGHLKRIISELAEYNFAKINSDIIGRIYEYHVSKDERKKLGQFYTPDYIIDYILNSIPLKVSHKLLDPACGSGGFLIRAYDRFLKISIEKDSGKSHKQILENNLFGYDINPFAVHMSAMNLALKNIENKTDVLNVIERDSLTSNLSDFNSYKIKTLESKIKEVDKKNHTAFNAIIGNPPYFNMNKEDIGKKYSGQGFADIATGVTNIASLFLKKYITLLEPSGYLGFVIPKSLTYSGSWEGIRKFILQETEIVKIFDVHEAFEGVLLEQIAIVLQKKPCIKRESVEIQYIDLPYTKKRTGKHEVKYMLFTDEMFPLYCFNANNKLKEKCLKNAKTLDMISESPRGLAIQKFKYLFTQKPTSTTDKRVLSGDDIKKYGLKKESYFPSEREEFKKLEKRIKELGCEKILVQNIVAQTGNHLVIIATLDDSNSIDLDTVNNIILNNTALNYKYVLGFLNSKLAEYYAFNFIFNRAVRTMHFESIRKLPIKIVPENRQKKVINLVDQALKENNASKVDELRKQIDKEIYNIYNLTATEIKLIEESYK
ncbi:MAG: N-6 DNA methylase [Candidatus Micrarchaeales archaeon]